MMKGGKYLTLIGFLALTLIAGAAGSALGHGMSDEDKAFFQRYERHHGMSDEDQEFFQRYDRHGMSDEEKEFFERYDRSEG